MLLNSNSLVACFPALLGTYLCTFHGVPQVSFTPERKMNGSSCSLIQGPLPPWSCLGKEHRYQEGSELVGI